MKIEELIEKLSRIRDRNPEKDVIIEVFDIKECKITRGWMFDLQVEDSKEQVKLRQKKFRGWNLYTESTKDIEEIESSLCPKSE